MKYLKLFESFSLIQEGSITFGEVKDIFLPINDYGLETNDLKVGNFLSMGDKKIIEDHKDFDSSTIFKGIMVRFSNRELKFSGDFFEDLQLSIDHFESRCNCKISSIFVRVPGGQWFSDVETLKNHVDNVRRTSGSANTDTYGTAVLFIDLVFKPNGKIVD